MVQLRGFPPFDIILNPPKATFEILSKVQDLASKVSDNKFNKIVGVANNFRKKTIE